MPMPDPADPAIYAGLSELLKTYPDHAVLADMPSLEGPGHLSLNHSGRGQNVWFEDGHVRFLSTPRAPEFNDDFFVNADGRLDLGVHRDDSAILPAVLRPSQGVSAGRSGGPRCLRA